MKILAKKILRLTNLKYTLGRFLYFYKFLKLRRLDELWTDQDYILKHLDRSIDALDSDMFAAPQAEHQIGRFKQFKKISSEILEKGYEGDVLEFGTWQGLGLILIAKSFGEKLGNRKIIGVDTFTGLPESSSIWSKGEFSDTSIHLVSSNISKFGLDKSNYILIEGLFKDKETQRKIHDSTKSIIMVHFDADLGSSTLDALKSVEKYLIDRTTPIYLLFDDWGCSPDEVPDAFHFWLESARIAYNFKAIKIGSTKFTRQFRLEFNSNDYSWMQT